MSGNNTKENKMSVDAENFLDVLHQIAEDFGEEDCTTSQGLEKAGLPAVPLKNFAFAMFDNDGTKAGLLVSGIIFGWVARERIGDK